MRIKTFIGTTIIGLALPFAALAGMDEKGEKLAEKLGLDEARAAQVQEIVNDYHEGKKSLKEQKKDRLKEVLTDEEMDKLKAMEEEKKDKKDRYEKDKHGHE